MGIIIEENNKKAMIQDLITEIANKTQGITVEQIATARKRYESDPRSLEEIKKELERLSKEITEAAIRRKEAEQQFTVNQIGPKPSVVDTEQRQSIEQENVEEDYYKTEVLELDFEEFDNKENVNEVPIMMPNSDNLQQNVSTESMELESMFAQENNNSNRQLEDTKAKQMIKVMDSNGFSSAMNLAFILTTMSIIGLFIASIVILISK